MTRSAEDIFADLERELQSILFAGYVTKERDPAQLFRLMTNDAARLRERLDRAREELAAKFREEIGKAKAPANGANSQPPRKA